MDTPDPVESRNELIKMVATVVGAVALFVAYSDWAQYGSVRTCPTTHLTTLVKALDQYRIDSDGALPPVGQQRELLKLYILDDSTFKCRTGPSYIWPQRVADLSKGSHLIVSCPKAAHGFIRTFAWGIEMADGKLRIVRVKNSGERLPIKLKSKPKDEPVD